MKIKMLTATKGAANEFGSATKVYYAGEELDTQLPWQARLAQTFVSMGVAAEVQEQPIDYVWTDAIVDEVKKPRKRVVRKKAIEG